MLSINVFLHLYVSTRAEWQHEKQSGKIGSDEQGRRWRTDPRRTDRSSAETANDRRTIAARERSAAQEAGAVAETADQFEELVATTLAGSEGQPTGGQSAQAAWPGQGACETRATVCGTPGSCGGTESAALCALSSLLGERDRGTGGGQPDHGIAAQPGGSHRSAPVCGHLSGMPTDTDRATAGWAGNDTPLWGTTGNDRGVLPPGTAFELPTHATDACQPPQGNDQPGRDR